MAGRFTKMRYDQGSYADELQRSTDPLLYKLDPNFANHCNPCFAPHGPRGGHVNTIDPGHRIDVDSILRGISNVNTKSNVHQAPKNISHYHMPIKQECTPALEPNHPRFTHPTHEIRGLGPKDMRLDYPLHDPQCNIFENFAVNTRLQAKDDHKTVWQTPMNQRDSLPVERAHQPRKCTVTVDCGYAPYK